MGEIKRSKENILTSCYKLHSSLHFIIETFKIEGLILRIYWTSHWRCSGKKVFLEITVYIFENFLKIALKLPCESVVKIPKKYLWRSSVLVNLQASSIQFDYKRTFSEIFFKGFHRIFQNTYFVEQLSLAASGSIIYALSITDQLWLYNVSFNIYI